MLAPPCDPVEVPLPERWAAVRSRPLHHATGRGPSLIRSSGRSRLAVNNWMPNIALYRADCAVPRWAQYKKDGAGSDIRAVMQGDGNFVLYHQGWNALWSSGTYGNPGSYIVMQNDGNLVIYNPGGRALWATGTQEDFSIGRPLGTC